MAVEYDISSDVAVIKETGSVSQCARVTQMYSGQITYDDEAGSKFATATINGKSQRVMLCIAVNGTVAYDDVPSLYSTVDGHRCLNIVTPTETGTPDDVPSLYETVVIDGQNVRAVRCIMINKTPVYDGVSSTCTFTGDDGKTHTAQLVNKITGGSVEVIIKGTSPLVLPDAIANSLSYVKAFGGTEQRNLPDGYIERQFIYMMAGSHLLTDLVPTYDCKIEIDFQTTSVGTGNITVLGGRTQTYGGIQLFTSSLKFFVDAFGTDSSDRYTSNVSVENNTRYKFTYDNQVAKLESGGTTLFTNTSTGTSANGARLCINGLYNNGVVQNVGEIYLYSFKMWNGQGELVMDLVPAVQKGTVPVVGFYDTVSGTFKTATAGTFAAGGEAVPTPDAPMDIVSNNGVLKYGTIGKNLFDVATATNGKVISTTGEIVDNVNYSISAPIFLKAGTYTWSQNRSSIGAGESLRCFTFLPNDWDTGVDAVFSALGDDTTLQTFTLSEDAYVRISYRSASTSNMQLELGSTATEYEPYRGGIYTDGTVETINAHGKNLFDQSLFQTPVGATITYVSYPIKNGTYTMSTDCPGSASGTTANAFFLAGRVTSGASSNNNGVYSGHSITQTITDGWYTVAYRSTHGGTPTYDPADYDFQLEQGASATTYTPYYNGGTATAEMLLKVDNYQDVQSIIDGVVTRNVGVKVFDGTENVSLQAGFVYLPVGILSNMATVNTFNGYCTHAPMSGNSNVYGIRLGNDNAAAYWYQFTSATGCTTTAEVKQWLADQYAAGTPVIVLYPLATPTTESVAGQTLQVQDGDNVLEITQASLTGLELEAQYQAAVSLTIQEVEDANLDNNVTVTIQ